MESDLAITPKRLGQIGMANYCPRCFWHLLRLKFRPPYNHFGGAIFKQMEKIQMAVLGHHLETDGELPAEFAPFQNLVSRVQFPRNWRTFKHRLKNGILLYGEPDEICNADDGTIVVCDHKSARNKGIDDPFLECYLTQIRGYALIAEYGLDLGKSSRGALFYWEVDHESVISDPSAFYKNKTLTVPVHVRPYGFDIDYSLLDPLLKEAQRVWDSDGPPKGEKKCKDCERLDLLFGLQVELDTKDQLIMDRFRDVQHIAQPAVKRILNRRWARNAALHTFYLEDHSQPFADDGMVAGWGEPWEESETRQ